MNLAGVLIGVAMVAFGLATLVLRQVKPAAFRKLQPMRERFGYVLGTIIHVVFYSLVPIGAGIVFIIRGIAGESFY
jgi:hypothetical protein